MKKLTRIFLVIVLWALFPLQTWAFDQLPDTGQTKCYDNSQEIPCPATGETFYGQDAQHEGPVRSYTKLASGGTELPDSATQTDGWIMTRDNVTGLIWEIKTKDSGIHNWYNGYTWCDTNPDTNSGGQGTCLDGYDTEDFITNLNAANFGGYNDWRLPTIKEISTLVESSNPSPAPKIDINFFPNTISDPNISYWASNSYANNVYMAWTVWFNNGLVGTYRKEFGRVVRAVRGGKIGTSPNLIFNGDGTVTDLKSGLMWQHQDDAISRSWEEALSYVYNLNIQNFAGYSDWRLPNRNELQDIVDYSRYAPAIYTESFPATLSSYWSSTTDVDNPDFSWKVSFMQGFVINDSKGNNYSVYVRAVRSIIGDINVDGSVDIQDVILVLKIISNFESSTPINVTSDVNGDGQIGIEEAIYALRVISEL